MNRFLSEAGIFKSEKCDIVNHLFSLILNLGNDTKVTFFCFDSDSIFLGLSCPDEASKEDLQQKLRTGHISSVLAMMLDLQRLSEIYQVPDLYLCVGINFL